MLKKCFVSQCQVPGFFVVHFCQALHFQLPLPFDLKRRGRSNAPDKTP